ncbi:MAG: M14 family zinc carboxypeptidase [Candidatus Aminicenantes bacterium]
MIRYKGSLIIILIFSLIFIFFPLEAETVKTPAEESNYKQYSQHEQITNFLSRLDHLSPNLVVKIIGCTKEREEYPAKDLFLCIISEERADFPQKLNRSKPTFFLIASQHGNEQSAKEAALWFIRDLAAGKLKGLLKKMNFLIIPQANPYGNWFNQRRNEQDLDLNRDHVKLEAPESEAIHHVFRNWMPELTMDVHEKGDSYYHLSIGCVSNPNISHTLQEFSRHTILAEVEKDLIEEDIAFHEYLITQRMGIDSSAGVRYRSEDLPNKEMMKRFSTTDLNDGRNSLGIYESLSFIQEGASRHDIQTLKERTRWQYLGIRFFSESVARHGREIIAMVRSLRENVLKKAQIYSEQDKIHLRMKYVRDENQPFLVIKKFEQAETPIIGTLKADKKAGEPLTREDVAPYAYPSEYKVVEEVVRNWFPDVEPVISVSRPLGYVIPSAHQQVVETLLRHDIKVDVFTQDSLLEVELYKIKDIVPAEYDYLPPQMIDLEKAAVQTIIKKGDFYIPCFQEGANLIPCLLEPQSQYGLIRYQKFDLVPYAGDIFPFYRWIKGKELPVIPYKRWAR